MTQMRRWLSEPHAPPDLGVEEVLAWVRRDVPELRSEAEQVTPDQLYRRVADSAVGEPIFRAGQEALTRLGYGSLVAGLDTWNLDRYLGLGNPWRPGLPDLGDRVIDLGCGAGVDAAVAAHAVGRTGIVVGLDRMPYLLPSPTASVSVRPVRGSAYSVPLRSGGFRLAVANGLPPLLGARSALAVLAEAQRLLEPLGSLRFTTLVCGPDVPLDQLEDLDIVEAIRSSKPVCAQYRTLLAETGFLDVSLQAEPSPFVPGYRSGSVSAVLVTARRAP